MLPQVTKLAPHLLDYEQQDCQEFLRFLLDGLSADLARKQDMSGSDELDESKQGKASVGSPSTVSGPSAQDGGGRGSNTISAVNVPSTTIQGESTPVGPGGIHHYTNRPQFSSRTAERIRAMTASGTQATTKLQLATTGGGGGSRTSSLNQLADDETADCCGTTTSLDGAVPIKSLEAARPLPTSAPSSPVTAITMCSPLQPAAVLAGPPVANLPHNTCPSPSNGGATDLGSGSRGGGKVATVRSLQQRGKGRVVDGDSQAVLRSPRPAPGETCCMTQTHVETAAKESVRAWKAYLRSNDSIITDIFGGQLQSSVECLTCHHRSLCFDPFLDLSIPIVGGESGGGGAERRGREPAKCTLQACMEEFSGNVCIA